MNFRTSSWASERWLRRSCRRHRKFDRMRSTYSRISVSIGILLTSKAIVLFAETYVTKTRVSNRAKSWLLENDPWDSRWRLTSSVSGHENRSFRRPALTARESFRIIGRDEAVSSAWKTRRRLRTERMREKVIAAYEIEFRSAIAYRDRIRTCVRLVPRYYIVLVRGELSRISMFCII